MQAQSKHDEIPMPWNKGIIMGQKPPLKRSEVWAIRVRLQIAEQVHDLAMFNMAIDSKLRACDLVRLRMRDVAHGPQISSRAIVMQRKTGHPVQFEITSQTRAAISKLIRENRLESQDYLFSSLYPPPQPHFDTPICQAPEGLDSFYWSPSEGLWHAFVATDQSDTYLPKNEELACRSTSARSYETGEHSAIPGIELDDALEIAEQTEI